MVSGSVKDELLRLKVGNSEKIKVIPLGLELDELLAIPENNRQQLNIGTVGRLVPIKNHKLFLDAIKLFRDNSSVSLQAHRFYVIGDGELRKELESYARKLGLEEAVTFCGWNQDVKDIYTLLDIAVLTSLNEGTPVSLIEAMAAGAPIISTDVGGVKDLFSNCVDYGIKSSGKINICGNGILCKSNDPQALAEAFGILVAGSDLRKKMGLEGRNIVKFKFSKERLINDISVLYNNCLKRSA